MNRRLRSRFQDCAGKWNWVSDVHVYIKSDAVIWFWQYCHLRTRQTSENQITNRKCVVQTNSRVKWSWFYSGMSEFNCLVVVLFSAMFSCFLLDSFELQEMVCLTKHGATFSSFNISRRTYCSGYPWWTCLRYDNFFLMLETEESVTEIDSCHILQEASELWSWN